jgi:hypothetical protein
MAIPALALSSFHSSRLSCSVAAPGMPPARRVPHTIEEAPMRMLVKVTIPHEPFNTAVRNGTAGETIQRIMGQIRPEAAYFTNLDGSRGAAGSRSGRR